ncbi:MAG: tyrosine-type recombinase/integrase [Paenibacillaceae bacterium]
MRTFVNPLKYEMASYIALQKNAGRYISHIERTCAGLDKYLVASGKSEKSLKEADITGWISTLQVAHATKKKYFSVLKGFSVYLQSLGIHCTLPSFSRNRGTAYTPYIFSDDEWLRIINESDNLIYSLNHLGSDTPIGFPVLVRLLYTCGLRLNEALNIRVSDIDFEEGVLIINKAKRNRQRFVPMKPSMTETLSAYCARIGIMPTAEAFVFSNNGKAYSDSWAQRWFSAILNKAGTHYYRKTRHERGPCLHCLRHTFVFQSFRQSKKMVDSLNELVPILSTYLGHVNIMETDRYLRFSYELYTEAHKSICDYTEGIFPGVWS